MFGKHLFRSLATLAALMALMNAAQAVTIETVPVGNLGNTGQWSGESYGGWGPNRVCGAVDYAYHVGKYEVTAGQYCEFLNAVAPTSTPTGCTTRTCRASSAAGSSGRQVRAATRTAWRPTGRIGR